MGWFNAHYIFRRVQTNIDRVSMAGETVRRPEDVLVSPSQTISEAFALDQIAAAERQIVSLVSAMFLVPNQKTYEGDIEAFDQSSMVRPLYVFRQNGAEWVPCRLRNPAENSLLESSLRKANMVHPAYTWDEDQLRVYPSGTVRVVYIETPGRISEAQYDAGGDDLHVSPIFDASVTAYVTAKAQRQLERTELHDLYMSMFEQTLEPFLMSHRFGYPQMILGGINDSEVKVE